MPTMMSALPSRAISSRTAGLRAVSGAWSPAGQVGDRPLPGHLAGSVARVGLLEGQPAEALRAPRADPRVVRRLHVWPRADEVVAGDDGLEEALALQQRDVEQPLPVEPQQVDDDEVEQVVRGERLRRLG